MGDHTSLIVGATRGIGLALVTGILGRKDDSRVIATYRSPDPSDALEQLARAYPQRLIPVRLDVTDSESLAHFGSWLKDLDSGVDLTVHAAGILHAEGVEPEKSLEQCTPEALRYYFDINSIAPLMVARKVLASQSRTRQFTFAALSAMVGSIGDNRRGGWYGYRSSKAALNQFIKTLANECRLRFPRAAIVAVHPGTTDTGLSRPFQRNISPGKLYSPEQTASRLLSVLGGVDERRSGRFLNWDGSEIPW